MDPHFPPSHTGQPASEKRPGTKAFQSWRWFFLAAILLATIAITTFYFPSAQAQGADGAITGLTLTSTTAGTLTVSWDAASPTPTDYRVDWAKSTEDYKSWKVDDGHVYTAETATTTTIITDLSHDTEYKIRMRARYYRGEHYGKSWGGPWAIATITVAGELAETPTPQPEQEEDSTTEAGAIDTLAATDDNTGQLVLTWGIPRSAKRRPRGLPHQLGQKHCGLSRRHGGSRQRAPRTRPRIRWPASSTTPTTTSGSEHATPLATPPPAHGTDRGPRPPPRSSCR